MKKENYKIISDAFGKFLIVHKKTGKIAIYPFETYEIAEQFFNNKKLFQ